MKRKIRAGIIGSGMMGPIHTEALRRLGHVEVVALAARGEDKARAACAQLQIPRAYGDYRALIADGDVEVVHNCTPTAVHFEITKAALEAGKHVISEKPLARDSRESRELVELAKRAGVVNAIHFNYRNYPLVQQMRAMVQGGELGRLFLQHGTYLQDWLLLPTDYNWRVEAGAGESRAVADIGSHWFDTVQHVTGDPVVEVLGDLTTVHRTRRKPDRAVATFVDGAAVDGRDVAVETEDCATVLFRTQSGAPGSVVISQISAGRKNRFQFELDYAEAALEWNQEEPNSLWIGRRQTANQSLLKDAALLNPEARPYAHYPGGHPEGYSEAPLNLFAKVYAHIAAGPHAPADYSTFADGHAAIVLCEAIVQSSRTRTWTGVAP